MNDLKFDYNYFKHLEPMYYYEKVDNQLSDNLKKKRHQMLDNENNEYIASQKWDGEWGMFIKGETEDEMLVRSRSLSKVTGEYGDKTKHVPHLVEEMKEWPKGTVVIGEICYKELGKVSTDVGEVLRSLPPKAIAKQVNNPLYVKVFDIVCYAGKSLMEVPYEQRIALAEQLIASYTSNFFSLTTFYTSDFQQAADDVIGRGGEGVVIQRRDNPYYSGGRNAWKSLKLKQRLPIMTLKVVGTVDANKEYNGKCPEDWPYIIDGEFVTKPYFYGWKVGITVDYEGTNVDAASGLTDEQREWLASYEAQQLIADGCLYADIKAMMKATLGGLRHPVVMELKVEDNE